MNLPHISPFMQTAVTGSPVSRNSETISNFQFSALAYQFTLGIHYSVATFSADFHFMNLNFQIDFGQFKAKLNNYFSNFGFKKFNAIYFHNDLRKIND